MVQKNNLKKLLIICGPTASSKSALAVECARLLNTEIISADSMYVYKGLDIGTAKPDESEKKGIVHHLIDVAEPTQSFSVGDYREMAKPVVEQLLLKGKIPIICGGTGFYINSLIYNLSYGLGPGAPEIRKYYQNLAKERGNLYVYDILAYKDPESAEKLHYNDLKRVIRALEIFENGNKKSQIKDDLIPVYSYSAFSIDYPRDRLYARINKRVDEMFDRGLTDEVKNLLSNGVSEDMQCMQGIGYKETVAYLKGEISLDECKALIKLNTRHYAKRQITFFKKTENLVKLMPAPVDILAERIVKAL